MFVSIITLFTGFLIGFIFCKVIKKTTIRGPDSNVVRNKIFKRDGKCYQLRIEPFICPLKDEHP